MINYKLVINADGKEEVRWKPIIDGLIEELGILHQLIGIMDRLDAEVRMMAAHLLPYNQVIRHGRNCTEKVVEIQEQSNEILEACEQKVMTEKASQALAESRDAESGDEEDEGGETLSEAEIARGIRRARVVIRAGGGTK